MAGAVGIEPTSMVLETIALPLSYTPMLSGEARRTRTFSVGLMTHCSTSSRGFRFAIASYVGGPGRNLHLHSLSGSFTDSWTHSCPADPLLDYTLS